MIWAILSVVSVLLILGFIFDIEISAKKLTKDERKKKGNLIINNKRFF